MAPYNNPIDLTGVLARPLRTIRRLTGYVEKSSEFSMTTVSNLPPLTNLDDKTWKTSALPFDYLYQKMEELSSSLSARNLHALASNVISVFC